MNISDTLIVAGMTILVILITLFLIAKRGHKIRVQRGSFVPPAKHLLEKVLEETKYPREAQRAAIQKIRRDFYFLREMVRHADNEPHLHHRILDKLFKQTTDSITQVEQLCSEYELNQKILAAYITCSIELLSNPEYTEVRLKLATKYNR